MTETAPETTRTPMWKIIAQELEDEIGYGAYGSGDKLPTEAALAARFGVNRHTVRRALRDMADRGLVHSRRGAGVFVTHAVTDYPISKRTRFYKAVSASGKLANKTRLRLEHRPALQAEAEALEIKPRQPVLVYEGLSRSGTTVLAHFISVFPAVKLPGLYQALLTDTSVTRAFSSIGIDDYLRAETRIMADAATAILAAHLGLREGAPVLRTRAINVGLDGTPLELGSTCFAGDRVALTVAD